MKKGFIICLFAFALFLGLSKNVMASHAFENIPEHKSLWDELYNDFMNPEKVSIGNSTETITVYGLSTCDPVDDSCEYKYAGLNTKNVTDYLKSVVTCSNGENYIGYKVKDTSESNNYKISYNGDPIDEQTRIVWTEDYYVKCMSSESTTDDFTSVDLGNNDISGGGNQGDGGTVDNPDGGVFTYYLVLAIIAFISYVLMILVKKFNVFKKI